MVSVRVLLYRKYGSWFFLQNLILLKLSDKKVPYYTSSDIEDRVDRALN